MVSIPALAEKDLSHTVEGEHGTQIVLENPDGVKISQTVEGSPLKGFVRYSYKDVRDIGRGDKDIVTVNAPVVILRIKSLPELPVTGADWKVGIPENPHSLELEWFYLNPKKPVEASKGTGVVKLYLAKMRSA